MSRCAANRPALWLLLLALCCLAPGGCSSKRAVYIPPEWQTPVTRPREAPVPPAAQSARPRQEPPPPPTVQGPILKQSPAIRESDVTAGSEPPKSAEPKKSAPARPPQYLASMHLVDQGRAAVSQGKPDAAIPLLEQAIQVDVYNGEAFLQLAKAWRMKGARAKALEFSRKAEILFQDEPARLKEVYLLQADIYKESGDAARSNQCRQKASKL